LHTLIQHKSKQWACLSDMLFSEEANLLSGTGAFYRCQRKRKHCVASRQSLNCRPDVLDVLGRVDRTDVRAAVFQSFHTTCYLPDNNQLPTTTTNNQLPTANNYYYYYYSCFQTTRYLPDTIRHHCATALSLAGK